MESSKVEYVTDASGTPPTTTAYPQPTPVEDLEKRLRVLRDAKVREYHDGGIRIAFERPQRMDEADMLEHLQQMAEQERIANGG